MEETIQHPSHCHPLVLQLESDDRPAKFECRGCTRPYEFPIYACGDQQGCDFYLHKSCAELPSHISSPLHPPHPLLLQDEVVNVRDPFTSGPPSCSCCHLSFYRRCSDLNYICRECGYLLDLGCASLAPVLKLRDPEHLFVLLRKVDFDRYYRKCMCDENLFSSPDTTSPVFFCVIPGCSRILHFDCAPLPFPKTARHHYHNYHDLVYTNPPEVEDKHGRSTDDEVYCDVCEEPRDPKFPFYFCKECEYRSHVYCAVAEVLPSLVEKYENDLLQRSVCLDPFLHHFEERVSHWQSRREQAESELLEEEQKLKALEEEMARLQASK